ncbi:MAG TPA: hypothetical protein VNA14_05625 [Mycobacteriales bacterium]|nr:hypothetical protein [Mycobacteriales bacterium]
MKRVVTLLAIGALAALPATSDAAVKRKERTVTFDYVVANGANVGGVGSTAGCGPVAPLRPCMNVTLAKDEKHIKFVAKDASGQSVGIQYFAGETNADYQSVAHTCNAGKGSFKKGGLVSFRIGVDSNCPGIPTEGTLTVVISNLP